VGIGAFTGKAAVYERARPSYPIAAVDYLAGLITPESVIADIGAGTGKLTRLLAERGYQIYAVEPNSDMLSELQRVLAPFPNAKIVEGTAAATGLAPHGIDLITCAQALHWFEPEAFRAECQRIGTAKSFVAAVYNHMEGGRGGAHRNEAIQQFFRNPTITHYDNEISYDRDSWRDYMMSHSHSPLISDATHESYLKEINKLFDERQQNGILKTIVQTTVYLEPVKDL